MERLNKLKQENIEKIIENLEEVGYQPNTTQFTKDYSHVKYDMIEMDIKPDVINFRIKLGFNTGNLPVTFSKADADYLESKGVDDWSIYEYWLEFTYSPQNEQDLEETLHDLIDKYE